jgi:hypothetical protein
MPSMRWSTLTSRTIRYHQGRKISRGSPILTNLIDVMVVVPVKTCLLLQPVALLAEDPMANGQEPGLQTAPGMAAAVALVILKLAQTIHLDLVHHRVLATTTPEFLRQLTMDVVLLPLRHVSSHGRQTAHVYHTTLLQLEHHRICHRPLKV